MCLLFRETINKADLSTSIELSLARQAIESRAKSKGIELYDLPGVPELSKEDADINLASYNLLENFPNPFNPSTVIKYQLPNDGFVSIKVFDILGNEITELVNEVKPAGLYNVEFNASNLASGVYIYRIQVNSSSGGYVASKKMLLTK